jgi:hypothetical protein
MVPSLPEPTASMMCSNTGWVAVVKCLDDAAPGACGGGLHSLRLLATHCERLLTQNVFSRLKSIDRQFGVEMGRQWVIDHVDFGIGNQFLVAIVKFPMP